MAESIVNVSDDSFVSEVEKSEIPTIVDFWAAWCGPCKQIAPIFKELSEEYAGKVKFAKVDVDQNPQTSIKYNVRSIPTLILFKGGAPVDQLVGAVDKGVLTNRIQGVL